MQGGLKTHNPSTLADVLDRILDKGVVIAGDVSVSLVGVELLTIRLRLLIASVDKAKELGIGWWESDGFLNGDENARLATENQALRDRLDAMEAQLALLEAPATAGPQTVDLGAAPDADHDAPEQPTRAGRRRMVTREL